jgi:hypothetical protein
VLSIFTILHLNLLTSTQLLAIESNCHLIQFLNVLNNAQTTSLFWSEVLVNVGNVHKYLSTSASVSTHTSLNTHLATVGTNQAITALNCEASVEYGFNCFNLQIIGQVSCEFTNQVRVSNQDKACEYLPIFPLSSEFHFPLHLDNHITS